MGTPLFDSQADRSRAQLAESVREAVINDGRRIVIVGGSGWIGRTLLTLLHEALGADGLAERVICFGSRASTIDLEGLSVPVSALATMSLLPAQPTVLFHLAFLTMDKVGTMSTDDYVAANQTLSQTVLTALDMVGVDRLFFASSGAASFADDINAAPALKLYGGLKREHEAIFADWALAAPDTRRTTIVRIFSVSGPWINKHDVYALASFIHDALDGRTVEVRAPKRVWRSYVAVRELLSLVFAILLAPDSVPVISFETGGEALELEQVALQVTAVLGGSVHRRPITDGDDNRYLGDHAAYGALLARHNILHVGLTEQIVETAAYLARKCLEGETIRG